MSQGAGSLALAKHMPVIIRVVKHNKKVKSTVVENTFLQKKPMFNLPCVSHQAHAAIPDRIDFH